jgi:diguanylate cyclase (GGDEF)-like protein/putative nucleotidyltransferase with HDIG domain
MFLVLVWLMGAALLFLTLCRRPASGENFSPEGVGLAIVLAAIAGARQVTLLRSARFSESAKISLGFLVTFCALLTFGVRVGVVVGLVSGLTATIYPHRQPLHQALFNVCAIIITAWLAGETLMRLDGWRDVDKNLSGLPVVLLAALVYWLSNSALLATAIGLTTHKSPLKVWRDNFVWCSVSYVAGASFAAIGEILLHGHVTMLLLTLPVLAFTFQSYKLYAAKNEQKEQYIAELQAGRQMLSDLYLSTVKSLATAIDAKDQYTHAHILRVQHYALAIAEEMGVTGNEYEAIKTGALLHDIGKLGVADYVLLKPGPLTADEYEKMKRHVVIGAEILAPVNFPWPVAGIVRHHHERWDGKGYPDGLAGEAIPLGARIMAVADVYDALTSARPYRAAWSRERTLAFLQTEAGLQFDPRVVEAFLRFAPKIEDSFVDAEQTIISTNRPTEGVTGQIHRSATELWVLCEVGQTLNRHAPLQERLEQLGRKLTSVLPWTTCAFLLYDTMPGTGEQSVANGPVTMPSLSRTLRVCAAAGVNADILYAQEIASAESHSARVALSRTAYRGAYPDSATSWSISHEPHRPVRSILSVSMVHEGEPLGAISLYHANADAFSPEDENLLRMVADQVQSAVYRDRLHDRTRVDSLTDSLTGLHNRRFLEQFIARSLEANVTATPYALLYLDLDNFKQINDSFGHAQGDVVLRNMARVLMQELRVQDIVVRLYGDEFVIVLPQTREPEAYEVAGRIQSVINRCQPIPPGAVITGRKPLSVSIGIACYPADGSDLERLLAVADFRMYADKTSTDRHLPAEAEEPLGQAIVGSVGIGKSEKEYQPSGSGSR